MTGRRRLARDFICEAPGAPADLLGQWWWSENRPPASVRRVGNHPRTEAHRWEWACRACGVSAVTGTQPAALAQVLAHLAARRLAHLASHS